MACSSLLPLCSRPASTCSPTPFPTGQGRCKLRFSGCAVDSFALSILVPLPPASPSWTPPHPHTLSSSPAHRWCPAVRCSLMPSCILEPIMLPTSSPADPVPFPLPPPPAINNACRSCPAAQNPLPFGPLLLPLPASAPFPPLPLRENARRSYLEALWSNLLPFGALLLPPSDPAPCPFLALQGERTSQLPCSSGATARQVHWPVHNAWTTARGLQP